MFGVVDAFIGECQMLLHVEVIAVSLLVVTHGLRVVALEETDQPPQFVHRLHLRGLGSGSTRAAHSSAFMVAVA